MAEKDLSQDMKQKQHNQKLLEKIRKIEDEIKLEKGNDNINVRYYEDCELTLGGNIIKVSVAEVEESKKEKNEDKEKNKNREEAGIVKTYNIYMNVKGQEVKIAEINEEGKLIINKEELEKIDPENKLGLKELGEDEKPDIYEINRVEGKTSEELEEEIDEKENYKDTDEITNKTVNEDEEENPGGMKKINLGVLKLINPNLKDCKEAYLTRDNSIVFEDKQGNKHAPEEYGFYEKKVGDVNFALNKMEKDGEISSNENPTKVYAIEGSDFGISTDFKTHHREVNVIAKSIGENHANSYSVIPGNLIQSDSGDITKYQAEEKVGIREGLDAGKRNETNEKAKEFLSELNSDDSKKFKQGFENEMQQNDRINDNKDLKRVIADVLQKEYNENKDDAMEIATKIVDEGKEYDEIKEEKLEVQKAEQKAKEDEGGRSEGEEAWERLMNRNS